MAAGWLTALKVIPWADVIEAAPGLAKSARSLFKRTQEGATGSTGSTPLPSTDDVGTDSWAQASQRIASLESLLAQATERQQAAAALIDTLATQNARLVEAVDALDKRCQGLKLALWLVAVVALAALIGVAAIAR